MDATSEVARKIPCPWAFLVSNAKTEMVRDVGADGIVHGCIAK